jgi:ABC-type transport system involved in Fe-S cluster assembly fused permease/ATPase subunit
MYDAMGGRILIDDCDLRDVTLASLTAQIGIDAFSDATVKVRDD